MILEVSRVTLKLILGHLGLTWRLSSAYEGTLEPYLIQFGIEKLEMASVMGICAGLVGPKSENLKKVMVFKAFFKGSREPGVSQPCKEAAGPGSLFVYDGDF